MPKKVVCSGGTVTAENIIVATHFPIINRHGSRFTEKGELINNPATDDLKIK